MAVKKNVVRKGTTNMKMGNDIMPMMDVTKPAPKKRKPAKKRK